VEPIQNFEYTSSQGEMIVEGRFASEFDGCICDFELTQLNWNGPGNFDADSFTHISTSQMVTVSIPNTAEFGDYALTLSATTCDGETTVTDEFVVTFKPEIVNCAEAVLTAPEIIVDDVLQLTLYQ
jgi:hypothetical protein